MITDMFMKSNEHKPTFLNRILVSTWKLINEKKVDHTQSSIDPINYGLPESLLTAVDKARLDAGYDVLPRFRHRSIPRFSRHPSSSPQRNNFTESTLYHSSSVNDIDKIPMKKVRFRRKPRSHEDQCNPSMIPRIFLPRPKFRLMMNDSNFMANNRCFRLQNSTQMPVFKSMPQRPFVRLRFQ